MCYDAHPFQLGVQVGQVTIHQGHDIHTGLTIILPRGIKETRLTPCYAATHDLNGMGELTGTHALSEYGYINIVRPSLSHTVGVQSSPLFSPSQSRTQ